MIKCIFIVSAFYVLSNGAAIKPRLEKPIDLGHQFDNDTIYWRGVTAFHFTKKIANRQDGIFYAMNEFEAGEHGGSHMDAPRHFSENGKTIGQIPLEDLIVPGIVVDITKDVKKIGCSAQLKPSHLEKWVEKHGEIPNHSVILVRTGWSEKYPNKTAYFGLTDDEPGVFHFPGLSVEAADWIIESKKIIGVGIDTASIDSGNSTDFGAHVRLQGNDTYLMENLNIKKILPAKGFTLIMLPMNIKEGTGAPLRIVAF